MKYRLFAAWCSACSLGVKSFVGSFAALGVSKELVHNIFISVAEQLVVVILENTCCNHTETTGY